MKFKKRKTQRKRASTFHGWGRGASHHKGSGNRGGKGRAGSGKRSDGKKPSFWKEPQGKHGFSSMTRFIICPINVNQIESMLSVWEAEGVAEKKGKGYAVDLTKTCYNKLLGTGAPKSSLSITVDYASKGAVEKVSNAGGDVNVLKTKVKKQKKKAAPKKKPEGKKADAEEDSE